MRNETHERGNGAGTPHAAHAARVRLAGVSADVASAVLDVVLDPLAHGGTTLKATPGRRVVRVDSAAGPLIVKHFFAARGLRKGRAQRRAEREFSIAESLRAPGLPAPEPIAVGELRDRGGTVYAAREIPESTPLGGFLEARFRPGDGRAAEKREWLARAIDLLVRVHGEGFDHRDFHGGNLLVSAGDLVVIDLHRVLRVEHVSARRRSTALADLLHTLRFSLDPADTEFAVRRYLEKSGRDLRRADRWLERVDTGIRRREARRVKSRTRRCMAESSRFTKVRAGGVRGWRRRDCDEGELFDAVAAARAALAAGGDGVLSLAARSSVALASAGGRRVAVKLYERDGRRKSLRGKLTHGRAGRAWVAAHGLDVRGVPVPRPLAWLRTPDRAFLLVDAVEDAVTLAVLSFRIGAGGDLESRASEVADAVGALLERLAAANVRVNDLSPKNVLLAVSGGSFAASLCDFDGVRLARAATREEWVEALGQLNDLAPSVAARPRLRVLSRMKRAVVALARTGVAAEIEAVSAARRRKRLHPTGRG